MGECNNENDKKKRVRDDSEADSPKSKRVILVDSDSEANSSESRLTRVHSGESCIDSDGYEVEPDSSQVNEIDDDILNILNDTDNATEHETTTTTTTTTTVQGLDSVIKSFEEEILAPGPDSDPNLAPESGELDSNLGYLLEASDDELGLPPTVAPSEEQGKPEIDDSGRVGPEGVDMSGFFWFEEDIRNYEGFGFVGYDADENGGGYVTIDGLFDHAEPAWRSESLQAI